jgi:AAA+ ATPase superfamily predicted ATPase
MKSRCRKYLAPFKVGGVVEPPYFVGRKDKLQILVDEAKRLTQNNVIIGPRRYGKTCLLHNVKVRVEKESDVLMVEVNCREMVSIEDFSKITIKEIVNSYAKKHRIKGLALVLSKIFFGKVIDAIRSVEKIGGSIAKVGEIYLKFRERSLNKEDLARGVFDFIEDFAKEKKQNMIIVFDEFQEAEKFNGFLFNLFKHSMDSQERTKYFFSGSFLGLLEKVFLREDAPLYLMAARHSMKPLEETTVVRFVQSRFRTMRISLSVDVAKLFHKYTGGIPFYVQKLGLLCFQQAMIRKEKEIKTDLVKNGWRNMLDEFDNEFENRFLRKFSNQQKKIIKTIASSEPTSLAVIAKTIGRRSTDISSQVNRLVEAMVLFKDGQKDYCMTDKVFRDWLTSQE